MAKDTDTQLRFLSVAVTQLINADSEELQWFHRRDVFAGNCYYMPYTVGLSLFRKGYLETRPPNHPKGVDLLFRATGGGVDRCQRYLHDG